MRSLPTIYETAIAAAVMAHKSHSFSSDEDVGDVKITVLDKSFVKWMRQARKEASPEIAAKYGIGDEISVTTLEHAVGSRVTSLPALEKMAEAFSKVLKSGGVAVHWRSKALLPPKGRRA